MKQGSGTEAAVIRQLINAGLPLPASLKEAPELAIGLDLYWRAYWDLTSCRSENGYIAWDKVQLWANTYQLDEDIALNLHFVVRVLDEVWHVNKPKKAPVGDNGKFKRK